MTNETNKALSSAAISDLKAKERETRHIRTFQVTVSFTNEQRDRLLARITGLQQTKEVETQLVSQVIRSEIISHLESLGLDASVQLVQRIRG